ncbi:MAG: MlaD family protein [Chitinispirillales bacterium]|jgi:phospholipid/cholesterol/gamma-HCH transport system substrate-binding protein|nr:MlaD family protein [Chitinispirillales bacterium]
MGITAAQKMRLGIFVVIGMAILAAFIAIPLGMKFTQRTKTFYTLFQGETLYGLDVGAKVRYNGMSIGAVEKISYLPEDLTKMKVEISVPENFPIKVDMHTTTGMVGITGLKYIEISGGSNESPLLKPGGEIPNRASMFSNIGSKAEELTDKVDALLSHLNIITHPDSLRSLKVIMDNVADITGEAKSAFGDVRAFIPTAGKIADTTKIIISEALRITKDIKEITGSFSEGFSGNDVAAIVSRMDTTVMMVRNLTEDLSLMMMQTREDFSVTVENLKETAENANLLMRMLSENPSLLIRGESRERDRR